MRSTIAIAAFAFAGMSAAAVPAMASSSHHKATYHKASYQKKAHYSSKGSRKHYAQGNARKHVGGSASGGMASYYWEGQQTASGARFNPEGMTAAHRTLPFGTRVRVTNQSNGQSVVVTINDRGPFVGGRVIDLSRGAARKINMTGAGVARVSLEVLGRG
ncbi:septal ring lytic transglycosylase RlpA family protein [Hyphomicrobium sp. 99]|uniref:septal ring lytic transglycosylase RlpA family protein n=1 Tax=Hyphomicrobium sp. 99 TaxID=1163419 RepID=UPI0005F86F83|nr:septal ring lytic transglycosylase RlpA family protein [Hyphomicrobium sp. 99]